MSTVNEDPLIQLQEQVKSVTRTKAYAFFLASTGFVYGVALLMFNGFLDNYLLRVHNINSKVDPKNDTEKNQTKVKFIKTAVNFSLIFGCMTACGIGNILYKKFGSNRLTLYNQIFYICTVLLMVVPNLWTLYAARYLQGISVYLWTLLAPLQNRDNIPLSISDTYGTVFSLAIATGVLVASTFGIEFFGRIWFIVIPFTLVFEIPRLIFCFIYTMESPQWMVAQGKSRKEIEENFYQLYTQDVAEKMAKIIDDRRNAGAENEPELWDLITPAYRLQFFVALVLSLLNQFTGMNLITLFSTDLFKDNNVYKPELMTSGLGVINFVGAVLNIYAIGWFGKRNMLIFGLFGQALGYCFFFLGLGLRRGSGPLIVFGIYLSTFAYIMSIGGLLFSYVADVIPPVGRFTVALIQWFFASILTATAKIIQAKLGLAKMFFVFQVCAVIGGMYYIGYGVETYKRDKEFIKQEFQKKRFYSHD